MINHSNHWLLLLRAFLMRLLVAGDKMSFSEILLSCWRGEQLVSLELRVRIWFILLSQNLVPSSLNFFSSLISFEISDLMLSGTSIESTRLVFWKLGLTLCVSEFSAEQLWLISDFAASISNNPRLGLLFGAINEFVASQPFQLLVPLPPPNFLTLISECKVGTTKSDYLQERQEIGWRLQLSFLLLLSSFSMMPRSRSLNLRRVSIYCSCCKLSYFCFQISQSMISTAFLRSSFSFFRSYIPKCKYYKIRIWQVKFEVQTNQAPFFSFRMNILEEWQVLLKKGFRKNGADGI